MRYLMLILFTLQGCSPNLVGNTVDDNSQLRDKHMTVGCYTVDIIAGFDSYFNTTRGTAEHCKLKCSKVLPLNFKYKYSNPRSGCSTAVGGD